MNTTSSYQDVPAKQALSEILAKAAHADRDQKNRRSEERFPFSSLVTLGMRGPDGAFRALADVCTVDVSTSGMGLLSKLAMPTGNALLLEMESGTPRAWRVPVRIIYCRPLFADVFRVGVTFIFD